MAMLKTVSLYRSDSKTDSDGHSFFECILAQLGVPMEKWYLIDEVDFRAEPSSVVAFKEGDELDLDSGK